MDREALVRRIVHGLIALAPLYYLLPIELTSFGLKRWMLLIGFLGAIIAIEAVRLAKGVTVFGLRPHEKTQIASFAWAAAGIVLALWLFPPEIAATVLVGMALADPLAGEMRRRGTKDAVTVSACLAVYFALSLTVLSAASTYGPVECIALAAVGALLAIPSEWFDVPHVDDDFTMLMVPALGMTALTLIL